MKPILIFFVFLLVATGLAAQDKIKSIEGGLGIVNSYRNLRDNGDPTAKAISSSRDGMESQLVTWGAFANYRRQLTNRVVLNMGLAYERLGFMTIIEARYSSQIVPRQGFVGPVPDGHPYQIIYTDIHHIIRLPVTGDYYFLKKRRFSWYVKAGFSLDFMLKHYMKRRLYYTDGSVKKSKHPDSFFSSNIATISLTSGIGGEYKLTDKASLRCNVLYNQNLLPFNNNPIRMHLQWLALNVGYNYRIN